MHPFITLRHVTVQAGSSILLSDIQLTMHPGEQWALTGASGSGKTTLAHTLLDRHHYSGEIIYEPASLPQRIGIVEQQHHFKNLSNTSDFYYQQRFNSADAGQTITVAEYLELHQYKDQHWLHLLHLEPLLDQPLIQLSNGQNKRLQLARALAQDPALLVLDNPFTGLDAEGRKTLHETIDTLIGKGIQFLLITSPHDIPSGITHVAVLDHGRLAWAGKKEDHVPAAAKDNGAAMRQQMLQELQPSAENGFTTAVRMEHVTIQYGERIILNDINWEVKRGERWNVSGPNGAGKSTLLSLITADNPQAYANEIYLFDRKRGSGESIWDIKKKIGFVSPELHLYFDNSTACFDVIASGLFDTIGLFRPLNAIQAAQVEWWIRFLHLSPVRHQRLAQLSSGQQRTVLLARALVKNPPLLILDEPCQGLDDEQTALFKALINDICEHFGTTLIYVSHYERDIPACVKYYLRLSGGVIT